MDDAVRLCTLFKFVGVLLGLKNIRPYLVETGSVLGSILRLRSHQKLGYPEVTVANLDAGIEAWLRRKGFSKDDMFKLEETAGSIIMGLIMLLCVLPRAPKYTRPVQGTNEHLKKKEIIWDGWERLDQPRVAAVNELYQAITASWRLRLDSESDLQPSRPKPASSKDVSQQAQTQMKASAVKADTSTPMVNIVLQAPSQQPDQPPPKQPSSSSYEEDLGDEEEMLHLLRDAQQLVDADAAFRPHDIRAGAHISNWVAEKGKPHIYSYTLAGSSDSSTIKLCYIMIGIPKELKLDRKELRIVQIEIAEEGHPNKYAEASEEVDPARHIAFKITDINIEGNAVTFYPRCGTLRAVFRTNQLADRLIYGHDGRESAKKTRRYAYVSAATKGHLEPQLQRFVRGAYTEDTDELLEKEMWLHGSATSGQQTGISFQ